MLGLVFTYVLISTVVEVPVPTGSKINTSAPILVKTKKSATFEVVSTVRQNNSWNFTVRCLRPAIDNLEGSIELFICNNLSCQKNEYFFSKEICVKSSK